MLLHLFRKGIVDYVAMDIKAPPAIYDRITRSPNTCIEVSRSISIILGSGVAHEFRTTWHPAVLSESELMDIVHTASNIGIKRYFLQRFQSGGVEDRELAENPESFTVPPNVVDEARRLFAGFEVR